MDTGFTEVEGSPREVSKLLGGIPIQVNRFIPLGTTYVLTMPEQTPVILVTPYNDLVWDITWRKIVESRGLYAIELTAR